MKIIRKNIRSTKIKSNMIYLNSCARKYGVGLIQGFKNINDIVILIRGCNAKMIMIKNYALVIRAEGLLDIFYIFSFEIMR